jgi:exonuclease V gamma subunit
MLNPDEIYQKLITAGSEWAEAEAGASLLEEGKKSVLSQLAQKHIASQSAKSMAQAESLALADSNYLSYLSDMVKARKEANQAKIKYFSIQAWCELKRTQESTRRAEMKFASEG